MCTVHSALSGLPLAFALVLWVLLGTELQWPAHAQWAPKLTLVSEEPIEGPRLSYYSGPAGSESPSSLSYCLDGPEIPKLPE